MSFLVVVAGVALVLLEEVGPHPRVGEGRPAGASPHKRSGRSLPASLPNPCPALAKWVTVLTEVLVRECDSARSTVAWLEFEPAPK